MNQRLTRGSIHPASCSNIPRLDYDFQGPGRRTAWFEGWYFKFQLDDSTTISLIPSLHRTGGEYHGHLQWIIARDHLIFSNGRRFSRDELAVSLRPFQLQLGSNRFTQTALLIDEPDLQLRAHFDWIRPYGREIMGPFRPFHGIMPCSHGLLVPRGGAIVSVRSELVSGTWQSGLYFEKDWGDTFPERYIWLQADFPESASALFFSIARVKVGAVAFTGFIGHLVLQGKDYTFATWNLSQCRVRGTQEDLRLTLVNDAVKCHIRIQPQASVRLKSPVDGEMTASIRESLQAPIRVIIKEETGRIHHLGSNRASMEYHEWFE